MKPELEVAFESLAGKLKSKAEKHAAILTEYKAKGRPLTDKERLERLERYLDLSDDKEG